MNSIFETEDREERLERQDSEVTLSTGTLLAIFFGLVVVCGVFFGFGYSMGRHSADAKAAAAQVAAVPAADETAATPSHPKPSALELLPAPPAQTGTAADDSAPRTVVVDQPSTDSATSEPAVKTAPKAATPRPVAAPAQQPLPATQPHAAPKFIATSAPTTARPVPASLAKPATKSTIMVQIAAISHPEDAEALVAALKKRGYAVAVHTEPQDKLLHVQVGPFATRDDAVAMRQKLLSDGYNAIIK